MTPIAFEKRRTRPLTIGLRPVEIMIGMIIVPTRITIPSPLDAEKRIEHTIRNTYAVAIGLSPASSAALRIIVCVTPTFVRTFPNHAPKNSPVIPLAILMAPLSRTFCTIVKSASGSMNGTPATAAMATAISGNARMVGSLRVIIRTTLTMKIRKIRIA